MRVLMMLVCLMVLGLVGLTVRAFGRFDRAACLTFLL